MKNKMYEHQNYIDDFRFDESDWLKVNNYQLGLINEKLDKLLTTLDQLAKPTNQKVEK